MPRVVAVLLALGCAGSATASADRQLAIDRAATWLASFPAADLRFDSAVMLHHVRATQDSDALQTAWEHARARADRDDDHPLRRFWVRDFETPASVTRGWDVPRRGEPRANTEGWLIEATHCDRNGMRRAALRYACTTMRDDGGYHTTHALWGLVLARTHDCEDDDKIRRCVRHLVTELRAAQPALLRPTRTLDIDLFAERALMQCLADEAHHRIASDLEALLAAQRDDGSWGVPNPDEPPYFRYHATAIVTWTLAICP